MNWHTLISTSAFVYKWILLDHCTQIYIRISILHYSNCCHSAAQQNIASRWCTIFKCNLSPSLLLLNCRYPAQPNWLSNGTETQTKGAPDDIPLHMQFLSCVQRLWVLSSQLDKSKIAEALIRLAIWTLLSVCVHMYHDDAISLKM